jgi:hypothetical protein
MSTVIVAGNHDAAGRLEAPHPLLARFKVHVVGSIRRRDGRILTDRHHLALADSSGEVFLHVLAVSYPTATFVDKQRIDEGGFGSLDRETLDTAVDALERLHSSGRKVGVITHVAAIVERIAVQVRVEKLGGGLSQVSLQ